ncbi:MAG: gliding motility-associated C-terminal domain-containing protein, partial [Bacteroidota bacterium]
GRTILPIPSSNGCDSTVRVNLQYFAPAIGRLDTTLCVGEQLDFLGQTFNANRRTGQVPLPTSSVNGCDSVINVSIDFYPQIGGRIDTTLCSGERFNYFGQIFHENRPTGQVMLPNATANGCDSLVDVNVTFRPEAFGQLDTIICQFTRLSYYGQFFDINRPEGTVRLPIQTAAGCDSTVNVSIDFHPIETGLLDTFICPGETLQIGDVLFDEPADNVLAQLSIPDQYGCDSLVVVNVREAPSPQIILSGDGIICPGGALDMTLTYTGTGIGTVILSSNPNERISLVNGTTTISRSVPVGTTVTILAVTGNGRCTAVGEGSIFVRETDLAVNIDVISGDDVYAVSCADGDDGAVLAIPSGGLPPYRFQWNTGGQNAVLRDLPAGNYNVMVTSARGCQAVARVGLTAPEVLFSVTNEVPANCIDTLPSLILRDVQGGISPYLFRVGNESVFRPVPNLPDTLRFPVGNTVLEIEDINGCRFSETFSFEPPPDPQLVASPSRAIIPEGDSVRIQLLTNLDFPAYTLSPGPDSSFRNNVFFLSPPDNTMYEVTATDTFGCRAIAQIEVIIDDFVPIYTPNVFSPNGDGVNDVFRIYARPTVLAFNNFAVYNRWGGKVFYLEGSISPTEQDWGWDGYAENGDIHEQDVYTYTVTVELTDGRMVEIAGDVLLLR